MWFITPPPFPPVCPSTLSPFLRHRRRRRLRCRCFHSTGATTPMANTNPLDVFPSPFPICPSCGVLSTPVSLSTVRVRPGAEPIQRVGLRPGGLRRVRCRLLPPARPAAVPRNGVQQPRVDDVVGDVVVIPFAAAAVEARHAPADAPAAAA